MMRAAASVGALGLAMGALAAGGASSASYADPDPASRVFTIQSAEITESSSLVVSSTYPSLAYTTNDSGDTATIYVLNTSTGVVVGRTTLAEVTAIDIEAMAGGADGSLVVADIGDNRAKRSSVTVYRIEQPDRDAAAAVVDEVTLTYVDGPRDAESVLFDARSGRVFVVSKQVLGASIYETPRQVFDREQAVLRPAAAAPSVATDATFVPGTELAVVRTYVGAALYSFPSWRLLRNIALPRQQQGESVAAPPGAQVLWVGSEGVYSDVLAVPLPALPGVGSRPGASPTPPMVSEPGTGAPEAPPESAESPPARDLGTGAVLGVIAAAVAALLAAWLWATSGGARRDSQ